MQIYSLAPPKTVGACWRATSYVYAEHSESKYINQITNKIIPYIWSSHTNITMWLINFHKPHWKQNECNDNNLQCVSADQTPFWTTICFYWAPWDSMWTWSSVLEYPERKGPWAAHIHCMESTLWSLTSTKFQWHEKLHWQWFSREDDTIIQVSPTVWNTACSVHLLMVYLTT